MTRSNNIRDALREEGTPPPREAPDFWSDFRARATMVRQDEAVPAGRFHLPVPVMRWAAGLAVAAVAAVVLVVAMPSPQANAGVVRSLEISEPYESVMILQDAKAGGTIIWVEGL